VNQPYKKYLVL